MRSVPNVMFPPVKMRLAEIHLQNFPTRR
uniref:Uncharacterized protein n=1 Tax=Caenorhabditis elegans TaxID=6239 RepID=Q968Z1_CAEEL